MFSGRRPGKRSIVGTRVCALSTDGFYRPGVISAIQAAGLWEATADRYVVEFEDESKRTFDSDDIVGAGFQSVTRDRLNIGQTVFITHNGREVEGTVERVDGDDIAVCLADNDLVMVTVRTDDIRLMKSRRSARLSESQQDTVAVGVINTDSPFESSYKRLRSTETAAPAAHSWPFNHWYDTFFVFFFLKGHRKSSFSEHGESCLEFVFLVLYCPLYLYDSEQKNE